MREVDEDGLAIRPNKTRLKRELARLQKMVVEIIDLVKATVPGWGWTISFWPLYSAPLQ